MKKNIRRVFWLYFVLFAALVVFLLKFLIFDAGGVVSNSLNPRVGLASPSVTRGDILDDAGNVLASSAADGSRSYPYGRVFSHVVGFADYSSAGLFSGVEAKYSLELENPHLAVIQRVGQILTGTPVKGNSLVLTLDAGMQKACYDALGKQKGAVIVMEPSTGKILAMVSYPNFDPNTIGADWSSLSSDSDNSPLLNRASQGLYPPGSVFKIVTALAAMENLPHLDSFEYDCTGSAAFNGQSISCFGGTVHGQENLSQAFAVSCNTFFATLGTQIGAKNLRAAADQFLFNAKIGFPLDYSVSTFPLAAGASENELAETAIGQGKTMVTPLQMALVACAVANGGVMMKPYVVGHELTSSGYIINETKPQALARVMTPGQAQAVTQLMEGVVATGTAKKAAIKGVDMAAKTGSAQNPIGADHGWFVGFAPADKPQYVVCVMGENAGGSAQILGIAKAVMQAALAAPAP